MSSEKVKSYIKKHKKKDERTYSTYVFTRNGILWSI